MRRIPVTVAALGASTLLLAACGSDNTSSSSSSSNGAASSSGGAAASSSASTSPKASIKSLTGVNTAVDLDPATAGVLKTNGVSVAPVAPATAAMANGTVEVSFPIKSGNVDIYDQSQLPFIRGTVNHTGGITFSAGGKSLTATNFIVDPGASTLTATVGGQQVQLLDLDGSKVAISMAGGNVKLDGTVAKLSQAAADALNQTFGVTIFMKGIPLGVVHITAAGM
ncbi:MAG: hypothetical protein NVSMB29_06030 [Candidatus Dormibacteria bacterium]